MGARVDKLGLFGEQSLRTNILSRSRRGPESVFYLLKFYRDPGLDLVYVIVIPVVSLVFLV